MRYVTKILIKTAKTLLACNVAVFVGGCTGSAGVSSWLSQSPSLSGGLPAVTSPLLLQPTDGLKLIAGETFNFSASGGLAPYTWTDGGLGFFTGGSGTFTVPLETPAQTISIQLRDGMGTAFTRSMQVQSFSQASTVASVVTGPSGGYAASQIEMGGNLYIAKVVAPFTSSFFGFFAAKPTFITISKSTDQGASWTNIADYQLVPGVNSSLPILATEGTNLYLVGESGRGVSDSQMFMAKSSDGGVTWTTMSTYSATGQIYMTPLGAVATTGGTLVVAFIPANSSSKSIVIRKCILSTWVCVNADTTVSGNSQGRPTNIEKDGAGNLYVAIMSGPNFGINNVAVKKSVDHGATWTTVYSIASSSETPYALAVSADGQSLAYGGSIGASTPFVRESVDSGVTWSNTTSVCPGWGVYDLLYDGARNALSSCFNYSVGVYTGYIMGKSVGSTSWSPLLTTPGDYGGQLYRKSNGDVLFFSTLATLQQSTNFGTSWTSLTLPSSVVVTGDAFIESVVQRGAVLYSGGFTATGSGARRAVVRKSTDSGVTWTTDLTDSTGTSSNFSSLSVSPTTQTLLAGGNNGSRWLIYRFDPAAQTWSLVENYLVPGSGFSTLYKIVADSAGRYYAVGSYSSSSFPFDYRSLIRVSNDDGLTWSDFETYQYSAGLYTESFGAVTDGTDLYVAGSARDSSLRRWIVRKWDGVSWTILDDDAPATAPLGALARSVLKTSDGSMYAVGENMDSTGIVYWVTRKKSPGGVWETVDLFRLAAGKSSSAYSVKDDASGRIFVSGYGQDSRGVRYSVVRVFSNGAWSTVDKFAAYSLGISLNIDRCLNSQMCVVGGSHNSDSQYRGFLRVLSP